MLPFSYREELSVAAWSGEAAKRVSASSYLRALTAALTAAQARRVEVAATSVSFRGGFLRPVLSGNLLLAIDTGTVTVDAEGASVSFGLCFHEVLVVGAMLSGTVAFPLFLEQPLAGAGAFVLLFAWLAGGNIALALWRFRRLLVSTMKSST